MKLGVCYNFFDGEELLEGSISSVRNHVDYICVIFQNISNYGNPCNPNNQKMLDELLKTHIDEVYIYHPNLSLPPHENEVKKRNIGLEMCRKAGCSHILGMDADEFYISDQLEKCKNIIETHSIEQSFCKMLTYFKAPIYQIVPPEEYYVPFICKIKGGSKFVHNYSSPVLVDPTRRLTGLKSVRIFKRDEIEMHHMSFVRKNIRVKLENSTAKVNFRDIESYIKRFERWKKGEKNFHPSNPPEFRDTKVVDNIFNINI